MIKDDNKLMNEVIKHNKSFDRQLFSKDTEGLLNGYLYQDTNLTTTI